MSAPPFTIGVHGAKDARFAPGWDAERLIASIEAILIRGGSIGRQVAKGDTIRVTARHRPSPSHKRDRDAQVALSWPGDDEQRAWRDAILAVVRESGFSGHRIGSVWGVRQPLAGYPDIVNETRRNKRTAVWIDVSRCEETSATLFAARIARHCTPSGLAALDALAGEALELAARANPSTALAKLLESRRRDKVAA